mgnify:CR=1 FL=1
MGERITLVSARAGRKEKGKRSKKSKREREIVRERKSGRADYQNGQRQKRERESKKQERDCEIVKECKSGREEYLRQEPGRTAGLERTTSFSRMKSWAQILPLY